MLSAAVRRSGPARSCGAHPFWTWERRRSRTSTRTCSSSSNRSRRRCDRAQLGGRADIAAGCRDHSKSVAWWLRSQRLLRLRPSAASSPCQVRRSVGSSALNRGRGLRRAWAFARANPPLRRPDTVAELLCSSTTQLEMPARASHIWPVRPESAPSSACQACPAARNTGNCSIKSAHQRRTLVDRPSLHCAADTVPVERVGAVEKLGARVVQVCNAFVGQCCG